MSFLKSGKDFINSETGKSILNDTINSAASAATSAIIDNDQEAAKKKMMNSLKRSGSKAKNVVGKIAKNKLEKVLTGKGRGKLKRRKNKRNGKLDSLLDQIRSELSWFFQNVNKNFANVGIFWKGDCFRVKIENFYEKLFFHFAFH